MTVSVRVQPVTGPQLKSWFATEDFKVLLLDCRSFVCYNNRHITEALNVLCPLLLKRRSNGPLPLDHLVTCADARSRLLAGFYHAILVYDEEPMTGMQQTDHSHNNAAQGQRNMTWVLETLFQEPFIQLSLKICSLVGGFNQFSLDYPSLCVSLPNQPSFNMPSPPAAPFKLTPPPSHHQSSSDKRLTAPTATAGAPPRSPLSPRPLLRRGPPLSLNLPNIKCINTLAPGSLKYTTASSPRSATPQVPSGYQQQQQQQQQQSGQSGPGYECNAPVRLLPHLYLGSNFHASRSAVMEEHGITAVLNVSRLPNYFPTSFRYMQIPVDDNTDADLLPWFEEAINFIESVERCKGRVLVHCHAGISRSATICLAYLMKVRQIRLEEAFELVRSERTVISPNLAFMLQLLRFENELASSRKENTDQNSPCNHTSKSFFSNSACSSISKYSDSTLSPTMSPVTTRKPTSTRQLSLGNSPLLIKRMARNVSLPGTRSLNSSPIGTDNRKQGLAFNFNLPVLPKSGAHSCASECPDLSPTPSPIFFPM